MSTYMLRSTADKLRDRRKVILVHGNADMDAVGSAYAVSRCFPPADIYAPGGIDRVSRLVSEKMGFDVLSECDVSEYELVVVVDTSSPEQFKPGDVKVPDGSVIIDHHGTTGKWSRMHLLCDDTKVACTEVVLDLMRSENIDITKDVGLALLGGMLTDSGHFQFANSTLLRDFAYVMDAIGIGMDEAMELTKAATSMSERVSVMKCIERSKFDRVSDMIVAVSHGGSFEASGCKALLAAGADVVFVGSQRDDEFRMSARATQEMIRRGISLGEIMKCVSSETVTDGGGHDGAAGLSGTGDVEAMLHICMQRTMAEFRKIKANSLPKEVD
ncbi:MAG: DHHA1 domain-containing protein [Candidatus Methanomethylophilaceae archaeon]